MMRRKPTIQVFTEDAGERQRWIDRLGPGFDVIVDRLDHVAPPPGSIVILDLNDGDAGRDASLVEWRRKNDVMVGLLILAGPPERRRAIAAAGLLRDANFLAKPLDPIELRQRIESLYQLRFGGLVPPERRHRLYDANPDQAVALRLCDDVLDEVFGIFNTREIIDVGTISERSTVVVDTLQKTGLQKWVDAVRNHHSSTYQHCLLVAGLIVKVGSDMGIRSADLRRLAVGGLLHDLGKAVIPLDILDKPVALTPEETAIMQRHPSIGAARVANSRGATDYLLKMVRDHHEYLDGSGYPSGLTAPDIPDPVRLLTIVDIFAALVEKRPYRSMLSTPDALAVLGGMEGKIDMDIYRAARVTLGQLK